jgi:hypothetical protein
MSIFHSLFYTCKEASLQVEKKLDDTLSFSQKLKLNCHLFFCNTCKKYKQQSILLNKAIAHGVLKNKANIKEFKEKLSARFND